MSSASTRISIRWPPALASEPTDTLVLSLGGYYVDLRVRKSDGNIDWLLVGERIVISENPGSLVQPFTLPQCEHLCPPLIRRAAAKVKFTHILDSQHLPGAPHPEPDVGDFEKLPNGDDLETGVMPNHDAGRQCMAYEEVWRELDWSPGSGADSINWIIEGVDDSLGRTKVFCAKIGIYFLAVSRTTKSGSDTYSAVRQDFDSEQRTWKARYDIGDDTGLHQYVGSADQEEHWKVGEEIALGGTKFTVRAYGATKHYGHTQDV